MKVFALTLAAACLVAGAASAHQTRIGFGDLNLASPAGATAFDGRIQSAARNLCRRATRPASRLPDREFCRAAVQAEVSRQLPARAREEYARGRQSTVNF